MEKKKVSSGTWPGTIADPDCNLHILYTEKEVTAEGNSCISIQKGKKKVMQKVQMPCLHSP